MRDLNAILRIGWELVALVSRLQAGTLRKAGREKAIWRLLELCEKVSSEGLEASFFERGGQQCTGDNGNVCFVALSSRNFITVQTAAEVVETDGRLDMMLSPLGRAVLWFPLQDVRIPKGEILVKQPLPHLRVSSSWLPSAQKPGKAKKSR